MLEHQIFTAPCAMEGRELLYLEKMFLISLHKIGGILMYRLPLVLVLVLGWVQCGMAAQTCRNDSQIPPSTPTSRFQVQGNGTLIKDTMTGLIWARCAEGLSGTDCSTGAASTFTWQQALEQADSSTLAGSDDWRLPNIKELRSLVEEQCYDPAINLNMFPNTPAASFWSSSPAPPDTVNGPLYTWNAHFQEGFVQPGNRSTAMYVRLVRAGQ